MDDNELDELLATRVQPLDPQVHAAVAELVKHARAQGATAVRPHRRRRFVVGWVALGAVVLTAGGTLTAAQLRVPPFQGLEPGVQRIQEPIPVDYVTAAGKDVRCQAFLEFRNLTEDQLDAAHTYVAQRDWSGFGQQAYNTAEKTAGSAAPDSVDRALGEVLVGELTDAAEQAVPVARHDMYATGPAINGHSMTCALGPR